MQSIDFPMRIGENGLLRREDRTRSLLALLQVMARTPQGSWKGCPPFGLRDIFEQQRLRADTARLVGDRINEALEELGITEYRVAEVIRELSPGRDTDTYAVVLESADAEKISTRLVTQQ